MIIKIPFLPKTTNEQIAMNRANKFMANKYKKDVENELFYIFKEQKLKKLIGFIELKCTFYISNFNRDCDNLIGSLKYVFDSMQKSGIIENDNLNHIQLKELEYKKVKKNEEKIIL